MITRFRVPGIVPTLNPIVRFLLRVGIPFGPNVLLTVRGRKSGLLRTTPVAMLESDGKRWIWGTFGEVSWVHNLRAAGEAIVGRGRSRQRVVTVELSPGEAGAVLQRVLGPMLTNPMARKFLGPYIEVGPDSSPSEFINEARRHPLFELRPPAEQTQAE